MCLYGVFLLDHHHTTYQSNLIVRHIHALLISILRIGRANIQSDLFELFPLHMQSQNYVQY